MNNNDLKKMIGQLFIVGFHGTKLNEEIKDLIHNYYIGSVILFARNIESPQQLCELTNDLQNEAKKAGYSYPLFITVDQENGVVRRITEGVTLFPGAMLLGATNQPVLAEKSYYLSAKEIQTLGINWNLAPDADINNNPHNPVIGVRSFGENPEKVADFVVASMNGMRKGKVMPTVKHFPGHGDTSVDSHLDLPTIQIDDKQLFERELIPFITAIHSKIEVIMTAHVYFPKFESEKVPASLSKKIMNDLLREKLQYKGLITTDCLEMQAISDYYGTVMAAKASFIAGADLMMISHTYKLQKDAIDAFVKAVHEGEISRERIEQSYCRLCEQKNKYANWKDYEPASVKYVQENRKGHVKIAYEIYREGITFLKKERIPWDSKEKTLIITFNNVPFSKVEDEKHAKILYKKSLEKEIKHLDMIFLDKNVSKEDIKKVLQQSENYENVIVTTLNVKGFEDSQAILVNELIESSVHLAVIALRNPYDLKWFQKVPNYITTYEYTDTAVEIACKSLFGLEKVNGKLPVEIE